MNIFHGVCLSHAKTYDEKKKKKMDAHYKIHNKISSYCSYLAGLKFYHSAAFSAFLIRKTTFSFKEIAHTAILQHNIPQISTSHTFNKLKIIGASKI